MDLNFQMKWWHFGIFGLAAGLGLAGKAHSAIGAYAYIIITTLFCIGIFYAIRLFELMDKISPGKNKDGEKKDQ